MNANDPQNNLICLNQKNMLINHITAILVSQIQDYLQSLQVPSLVSKPFRKAQSRLSAGQVVVLLFLYTMKMSMHVE